MVIKVECHSGYKVNDRPLRFQLGDSWHDVDAVEDRWYSPGFTLFRVIVRGGERYLLRYDEGQDFWELVGFRASAEKSAALTQK